MRGLLVERVRCWLRGHTFALRFRDGVPGYECATCLCWRRSPLAD